MNEPTLQRREGQPEWQWLKRLSLGLAGLGVVGLMVVVMAWLTPGATAGRLNGSTPFTAQLIEGKQAIGTLGPGETEWHQFSLSEGAGRQVNLSLVYTPNQPDQSRFVEFGLHDNAQLEQWYLGTTTALPSLGESYVVMRDEDPNTGELFLSSRLEPSEVYYIRVTNNSDFTIHYSIFIDVEDVAAKEAIAPATTVLPEPNPAPVEAAPAVVEELPAGIDPNHPVKVAVVPQQLYLHEGQLGANSDQWVELRVVQENGSLRQPLELTLFATPGDGNMVHKLHLDLFANVYAQQWSLGNEQAVPNFGAGRIVERDGDPLTAELVWNGHFNNDEPVLVRLRNDNPFAVDFYLFTGDIINVELGEPAPPPAPVRVAPGVDPNHSLPLALGQVNEGDLQPGQERWYQLKIVDFDGESKEHLQLTLYQTPNGGHNMHRVHLEIFNAGDRHIWSRGDTERMPHFGSGAIVDWDEDEQTGILFWDGWLVDGNDYLIRVRNSAQEPIHYWLFTEAAQDVSLGELE